VTYLIEYPGELEFIFKTVLGYESGDQMGYFEANKTESKISCLGTFKLNTWQNFNPTSCSYNTAQAVIFSF
jgi:hypothetical protein